MHIHSTDPECCPSPLSVTVVYCERRCHWRVVADGFHGTRHWEDDIGYHDEVGTQTLALALAEAVYAFDRATVWLMSSRSGS